MPGNADFSPDYPAITVWSAALENRLGGNMQEMKMNSRVKKILLRICGEPDYVTISSIAKELEVSTKTILRELQEVEQWLEAKGCSLSKKTGAGIKINGSEDRKKIILTFLHDEKEEDFYSPKERQIVIISELLQNQEPVKLYNFTKTLKVTEGTISNDLDKAQQWFARQGLKLIRKPGLGVYVKGQESVIRKAMVNFIYENMDEDQLLGVIRSSLITATPDAAELENDIRRRLLNLIDKEVVHKLEFCIHAVEAQFALKLADSAYVGLMVHLALAVQRIKKNIEITIDREFLQELKKYPEYTAAAAMSGSIAKKFFIEIPESEIGYITMHIKGSKSRNDYLVGNFELVKLAKEIIKVAEAETGRFLIQNEKLLIGLVNHLGPSLSRLKMNLDIRNPFLEEINALYPDLVSISRKCAAAVEKRLGIRMPEPEIAYIAMHLGAAIEDDKRLPERVYRCAIACATGIGTSRLLATRLEREFSNIEIVDIISTIHIEESELLDKKVDFIISTVSLGHCPLPVVTVNPLLFAEDKERIDRLMKTMGRKAVTVPAGRKKTLSLKEKLLLLHSYSTAIIEILDNFFLYEDTQSAAIEEVIEHISAILGGDKASQLSKALREREQHGGTFITGHHFILLHCRTEAIGRLQFGAVRIKNPIAHYNGKGELEEVNLGVIMLVPESGGKNAVETISYISRLLIERESFLRLLINGTTEAAYEELSRLLAEFYQHKNNNLMEA
jgi:mannitol operon transcriptional antiterminator